MKLYVFRDGKRISTHSFTLSFSNRSANYSFNIEIPAERNNYRFSLYGATSWSESHQRTVNNVVAGDAYIIQGQSNAVANLRGSSTTENNADDPGNAPNRNFVRVYGSGHSGMNYTKAWFIGKGNVWYDVDGQVGQWGMRLGSNLAGATNIPVALINGAMPGVPLSYFQRNDADTRSLNTNYGRLLRRIEEAGLKNNIRAILWYQGESDNQGVLSSYQLTTQQYKDGFNNLYSDWKQDFPGLNKFYIVQIRFGCGISSPDNCLKIQEAQRQLDKASDEILTISSNNTSQLWESTGIEFCHYNFVNGYKNIGDWLSSIVRRDLYGTAMPLAIESPEPISARFSSYNSNGTAKQLALELKDQQSTFTMEGNLLNDFRLDDGNFVINSVTLENRTIYINFSNNTGTLNNPGFVSYRSHQGNASPIIKNHLGLGLIHFERFPIEAGTPIPPPDLEPVLCPDNNEPNNTIGTARPIEHNSTRSGSIYSSVDEDWFAFRTWDFPYFKISLWNLPADYDLYLYTTSGVLLASSVNSGTTAEVINYNAGLPNSIYRIKVVSKNGTVDPSVCYLLRAGASSAPISPDSPPYGSSANTDEIGSPMEMMSIPPIVLSGVQLYPNPANNQITIEYQAVSSAKAEFSLIDMAGRIWQIKQELIPAGFVQYRMAINRLPQGNYVVKIKHGNMITNRKLTVINQ
jgi:hypothetical protein